MNKTLKASLCAAILISSSLFAQEGRKQLKYWGSADNYQLAQGTVLLEQIDQAMDLYKPSTKPSFERKQALYNFDAVVHNTFYDNTTVLKEFAETRVSKVRADLDAPMKKGVRVYKVYNDGFIIRTKSTCIAVDLNARQCTLVSPESMKTLVDKCEALFITHNHSDHYDQPAIEMFLAQGKPVYAINEYAPNDTRINHVWENKIHDITVPLSAGPLKVKIFPGHQDELQNHNYVFYLPEGYTVAHTGDQYNEDDLPMIYDFHKTVPNLDILIVECWIHHMPEVLKGYNPKVIITGHENELGHTIDHREAFWLTYYKMEEVHKVTTPYVIMGWGEWFEFK